MTAALQAYGARLMEKSRFVSAFFGQHMQRIALLWLLILVPVSILKLSTPLTAFSSLADLAPVAATYAAILAAPMVGYIVAKHAFHDPVALIQPQYRFARIGKWRPLDQLAAKDNPAFGPIGFMASLLVGMLLNVAIRTGEFILAIPVMGSSGAAWGNAMFNLMAIDVIVTSFFYMVAFVMALRTIPLFPRMLLYAWVIDISMQLLIARELAAIGGVPADVVAPLINLLAGNIDKVLISAAIWLPYLLLSDRVNVTYRHRCSA